MRLSLALVAAGLLGAGVAGCVGPGHEPDRAQSQPRADRPDPERLAREAGRRFLDRYVGDDGRVSRLDQRGDTVGEGQAYAMLVAVALRDGAAFDRIWGWTDANLRRPDGLLAFLWRDGKVADPQPASDADLDAARALLLAGCHFDRPDLAREGEGIGKAVLEHQTTVVAGRRVLVAGPWARRTPATVNPSYFAPPAYMALYEASGDRRWGSVADSSRRITAELMRDPSRLPPDWARVAADGAPEPSGPPDRRAEPARFGFDAARALVRLAEQPRGPERQLAAESWPFFQSAALGEIFVEHELTGAPAGRTRHPIALVAAAAAAHAAGSGDDAERLLQAAGELDAESPTYYGAAWVALGRTMLTTDLLEPCTRSVAR